MYLRLYATVFGIQLKCLWKVATSSATAHPLRFGLAMTLNSLRGFPSSSTAFTPSLPRPHTDSWQSRGLWWAPIGTSLTRNRGTMLRGGGRLSSASSMACRIRDCRGGVEQHPGHGTCTHTVPYHWPLPPAPPTCSCDCCRSLRLCK